MKKFLILLILIFIIIETFSQNLLFGFGPKRIPMGECNFILNQQIGKSLESVFFEDILKYDSVRYYILEKNHKYLDTIIYSSCIFPIDASCGCYLHKIYYFKSNICVKIVCNYISKDVYGQMYLDKQEIITLDLDQYLAILNKRKNG